MNRRELHDRLLDMRAQNPELAAAQHDVKSCVFCSIPRGGEQVGYTEEQLRAAVDEATAPLLAKIAELQASEHTTETAALVAAATADQAKVIEELRAQLDLAVLARQTAVDELVAYKAEVEAAEAARKERKQLKAKRDERLARVQEVASFPKKHLEDNADRWAQMSEKDFQKLLAEYASLRSTPRGDEIPKQTALFAARESGASADADGTNLYKQVIGAALVDRTADPRKF